MSRPQSAPAPLRPSLLAGLALALAACGGGEAPAPAASADANAAHLRTLALHLVQEGALAARPAEVVATLYPPADVAPWSGQGERVFRPLVPASAEERGLPGFVEQDGRLQVPGLVLLQPEGQPREVRVPLRVAAASFDRVRLRVSAPKDEALSVALLAGGREVARSEAQTLRASQEPKLVTFDLPALRAVSGEVDELRVVGAGRAQGLVLVEVALLWQPLTDYVPATDGPARLVDLGGSELDQRRGVGVFSDAPAEVVFEARAGEELRFCTATPPAVALPDSTATLRVSVEDAAGARVEGEFPAGGARLEWHEAKLGLAGLAPGPARALFELVGAGAAREACVVGELRVLQPRRPRRPCCW
ncbi:MAG: hypothetical protein H6828_06675 [Planctomycetes bacterium]|nr:hypothetical protein [Planctomycetota bacterium]